MNIIERLDILVPSLIFVDVIASGLTGLLLKERRQRWAYAKRLRSLASGYIEPSQSRRVVGTTLPHSRLAFAQPSVIFRARAKVLSERIALQNDSAACDAIGSGRQATSYGDCRDLLRSAA
jgi:hypothetical protein